MAYFFGIDGGGTHSRLAIVNEKQEVIARAGAGSTNIYSVSREAVYRNIQELIEGALKEGGLKKADLAKGCIGNAGLGRPAEIKLFREMFDSLLSPGIPVKLCSDAEILLCGGLNSLEGFCLIAGTGSIAFGRSRDGRLVRAGGLGYMLGDEGAAAWIGKEAVTRTMRSAEMRDIPTGLMPEILKQCGLEQSGDLIEYIHHKAGKPEVAKLAPLVTEAARKGDALANDILAKGAFELSLLVKSVIEQAPWIRNMQLVTAGGVMEHDEIVSAALKKHLRELYPGLEVTAPRGTALQGACILAAEAV